MVLGQILTLLQGLSARPNSHPIKVSRLAIRILIVLGAKDLTVTGVLRVSHMEGLEV